MNDETARDAPFDRHSLTWRFVVCILGSVGIVFLVTVLYSDRLARDLIVKGAEIEARNLASAYAKDLRNGLRAIEARTELLAFVLGRMQVAPDELDALLRAFVERSETIHGAAAAFAPRAYRSEPEYFGPRHFRRSGLLARVDLASDAHRYREREWYQAVVESAGPRWSEPYDEPGEGGGRIVTYSAPIFHGSDPSRGLRGVVASDVSLDWLHERMKALKVGGTGFGAIVSSEGFIISHPDESLPRGVQLTEAVLSQSTPEIRALVERMQRGESGFEKMMNPYLEREARTAFEPVGHASWSVAVVYPEEELLADATRVAATQRGPCSPLGRCCSSPSYSSCRVS